MMSAGVSSSKIDDGIDAGERRQQLGAFSLRNDRPRRALVRADGPIGVDADDERVALGARGLQIPHVAGMQKVEHAVREHHPLALRTKAGGERACVFERQHAHARGSRPAAGA